MLITLYNAPGRRLRMTELAQRVLLTPSGLSHLVTRLEGKGFVARLSIPTTDGASSPSSPAWATGNFVGAG